MITIATDDGLFDLTDGGRHCRLGEPVRDVFGRWAVTSDEIVDLEADHRGKVPDPIRCVTDVDGEAVAGTANARLYRWSGTGSPEPVESFERIPSRDDWYTPWGAPPDTRSLAVSGGVLLVNVHVGGVWRGDDGWSEVVTVDDDTHQVVADGTRVAAAAAVGVGRSRDGGRTWDWSTAGLHAGYCRAVALAGDVVLVTASDGPSTRDGRVYRAAFAGDEPFSPCGGGLPESFPFNLDTGQLAAAGDTVALGTSSGELWRSDDAGATWALVADGLGAVRSVALR